MKNIKNTKKTSFIKKIFIKLCRKLGYEIIDQNKFEIPTLNKKINDDLSEYLKCFVFMLFGLCEEIIFI